jgi:hypothetical protein
MQRRQSVDDLVADAASNLEGCIGQARRELEADRIPRQRFHQKEGRSDHRWIVARSQHSRHRHLTAIR